MTLELYRLVMRLGYLCLLSLFLCIPTTVFSQPISMQLTVHVQHETCANNASLQFELSNTQYRSVVFSVYKFPDLTAAVYEDTINIVSALSSGDYRVIAFVELNNGEEITLQNDVTIDNRYVPLELQVVGGDVYCGNDGSIRVNVPVGNAVSYSIVEGPMLVAPQNSNFFEGLVAGTYLIKVLDSCGQFWIQGFTLFDREVVYTPTVRQVEGIANCETGFLSIDYPHLPNQVYPINLTITINTDPIEIHQLSITGPEDSFIFEVPYAFDEDSFTIDIAGTSNCGDVFSTVSTPPSFPLTFRMMSNWSSCTTKYIEISPSENSSEPYFVEFTQYPQGFVPENSNLNFPGPFSGVSIFSLTSDPLSVPEGIYEARITMLNCGHDFVVSAEVNIDFPPRVRGEVRGDYPDQWIEIFSQAPSMIDTIHLLESPLEGDYPIDFTEQVMDGSLILASPLPTGTYVFEVLDSCGYTYEIVLELNSRFEVQLFDRPGCGANFGGVNVYSDSENIVSFQIIAAPHTFEHTLPYEIILSTSSSNFGIGEFPIGEYQFVFYSATGNISYQNHEIVGAYTNLQNITIEQHCSMFHLSFQETTNVLLGRRHYLQKYYPDSQQWGHPVSGILYNEGSLLNANNGLIIDMVSYNHSFTGTLRIVKTYQSFGRNFLPVSCSEVVHVFEILDRPELIGVQSVSCESGRVDVEVNARGIPPLSYSLITFNGEVIEDEEVNQTGIFTNLVPGLYELMIEDSCGNTLLVSYQVQSETNFTIDSQAFCEGEEVVITLPYYSQLSYQWYKTDNPSMVLNWGRTLTISSFVAQDHSGNYEVLITSSVANSCMERILPFTLTAFDKSLFTAGADTFEQLCDASSVDLVALLTSEATSGGKWYYQDGTQIFSNTVDLNGLGSRVELYYEVTSNCGASDRSYHTFEIIEAVEVQQPNFQTVFCEFETLSWSVPENFEVGTYHWEDATGNVVSNSSDFYITQISFEDSGIIKLRYTPTSCKTFVFEYNIIVQTLQSSVLTQECYNNQVYVIADNYVNWYFEGEFVGEGTRIPVVQAGVYQAELTTDSCTRMSDIMVQRTMCELPRGITPNEDGANDSFDLTGWDVKEIKIYNRYGTLLFESKNYTNQWYGQCSDGTLLPAATYFYVLHFSDQPSITGWVYLQRE